MLRLTDGKGYLKREKEDPFRGLLFLCSILKDATIKINLALYIL